jgi:hypothetical protein
VPPSLTPPVPVAAQVVDATDVLTVTFDQPLQPGATGIGNWLATWGIGPVKFDHTQPAPGVIAGNTVTVNMAFPMLSGGPPVCSYLAAPPDVLGLTGLPAAPFAGFPMVVI